MEKLISKALNLESLTPEEGLRLFMELPLPQLQLLGDIVRYKHIPERKVSWQIDRNVNITNVCISGCKFCNFHCKLHQTDRSYITSIEEYKTKIDQMLAIGGDQLLLQGGLHPKLDIVFYEELFSELKTIYPSLKLHALGAPEVAHIAKISSLSIATTLQRLHQAGLESLPGAGAEILDSEIRSKISPGKCSAEKWLEVMEIAHQMNLPTSATMVYGHIESPHHIIEHLIKLRSLQERCPEGNWGFLAFIPWVCSVTGTQLEGAVTTPSGDYYLRVIAISRILLNNIKNIQASWLTLGKSLAQIALHSGANDLGSIMIEENVVASTGLNNKMGIEQMTQTISEAGFTPWLRDQLYHPRTHLNSITP